MHRVIVVPRIHQKGLDLLEARKDVSHEVVEDVSEASLKRAFADADGAVVRAIPISRAVIEGAKKLKVVSRHGVGYNNLDVGYLTERGIPLTLTIEANALSVAEHTIFFLLSLAKRGLTHDRATRDGNWNIREKLETTDISGKTLLVVGFGRIGQGVAARASAFGMTIVVYDPIVDAGVIAERSCKRAATIAEALPSADFLTVHVPLVDATRGLIGKAELALMHKGACVINTARGGIVDEPALIDALATGRLRGAALDVFEQEPPAKDNLLFKLPNVILSPHSAGLTLEGAERMAIASVENVLATFDGRLDPTVVVNRQVLNNSKSRVA
jgi:D-3-phosphoglycerate dehydrogenase / 2-oxoglutarate reductase